MKVHCKYDKLVAVKDIKPNPKNPNIHPKQQIELLAKVLQETGWRAPIVVSNRSGLVVKGHGRLAAARAGGGRTASWVQGGSIYAQRTMSTGLCRRGFP